MMRLINSRDVTHYRPNQLQFDFKSKRTHFNGQERKHYVIRWHLNEFFVIRKFGAD